MSHWYVTKSGPHHATWLPNSKFGDVWDLRDQVFKPVAIWLPTKIGEYSFNPDWLEFGWQWV